MQPRALGFGWRLKALQGPSLLYQPVFVLVFRTNLCLCSLCAVLPVFVLPVFLGCEQVLRVLYQHGHFGLKPKLRIQALPLNDKLYTVIYCTP